MTTQQTDTPSPQSCATRLYRTTYTCPLTEYDVRLESELDLSDTIFEFLACWQNVALCVLIAALLLYLGYVSVLCQEASWHDGAGAKAARTWQDWTGQK